MGKYATSVESQKRNKIIKLISNTNAMLRKLGTTKSRHFEAILGSGAGSSWTFSSIQQFIQAFIECLDEFTLSLSICIDLRTRNKMKGCLMTTNQVNTVNHIFNRGLECVCDRGSCRKRSLKQFDCERSPQGKSFALPRSCAC